MRYGPRPTWSSRPVPWLAGAVLALVMVAPALGPGSILNLDLVMLEYRSFPEGFWGLGTEVPRPLPLNAIVWLIGSALGHLFVAKAFMVLTIVTAFVGMHRLVRPLDPLAAWGSAFLYGASPFLLTRIYVGHWTFAAAMAVLPWVLPTLTTPARSLAKTYLAGAALSLCGFFGGLCGGLIVAAAMVVDPDQRRPRVLAVLAASQIPWLAPGLVVALRGPDLGGSGDFPSDVHGLTDGLTLLAGHGFWQEAYQVGGAGGPVVAIVGLGLAGFAIVAAIGDGPSWARPLTAAAAVSLGIVVASLVPGPRWLVDQLTATPVGAVLRETQRILAVYVLWLAALAPLGAGRLARHFAGASATAMRLIPVATAVLLGIPGIWGAGQLVRFDTPAGWAAARSQIIAAPGPVLVLPWNRYLDVDNANGRLSFNPAAEFVPGDVVISPDLGIGSGGTERVDPRTTTIEAMLDDLRRGDDRAEDLAAAGIRWVLILHEARYLPYLRMLDDPGLRSVVVDSSVDLLAVESWTGPARGPAGEPIEVSGAGPLRVIGSDAADVVVAPYAAGWTQGLTSAMPTSNGQIGLRGDSRLLWYWPAALVCAAYLGWMLSALGALRRAVGGRPRRATGRALASVETLS